MQTQGEVVYQNVLRESPTYVGTVLSGFEPQNAYDWRDFSLYRLASGGSAQLICTPSFGTVIDRLVCFLGALSGTVTLTAAYEVSPGVWTSIGTLVKSGSGLAILELTTAIITSGERVRVLVGVSGGDAYVRQIVLGGALSFPRGQHSGLTPAGASLFHGVATDNVIAVNGSILARNYRREVRSATIELSHLEALWVRNSWTPFARHMARYACIWRWAPFNWPDEVVFAAATSIEAPENTMPVPLMKVSMPLRCLV